MALWNWAGAVTWFAKHTHASTTVHRLYKLWEEGGRGRNKTCAWGFVIAAALEKQRRGFCHHVTPPSLRTLGHCCLRLHWRCARTTYYQPHIMQHWRWECHLTHWWTPQKGKKSSPLDFFHWFFYYYYSQVHQNSSGKFYSLQENRSFCDVTKGHWHLGYLWNVGDNTPSQVGQHCFLFF